MTETDLIDLLRFVRESNHIEGIYSDRATSEAFEASKEFMELETLAIEDVSRFVLKIQPNGLLRTRKGMNVQVGNHVAPPGGKDIVPALKQLLDKINNLATHPWTAHNEYETLHPYIDGNGRSGRIIWRWHMQKSNRPTGLGFLHHFYYQTLEHYRK